jgi:hypothetical protein
MRHTRCKCCSTGRFLLGVFIWLTHLFGVRNDLVDHWAWEMTPIPMGFPSWRQYLAGVRLFVRMAYSSGNEKRVSEE